MNTAQDQQSRAPADQWKCGNEFLPYHPSASHVEPAYRDGWNACFKAAAQVQAMGRVPPTEDLKLRCAEILGWQKTGILTGNALRKFAANKYPEHHDALQMAERATAKEAYAFIAAAPRPPAAQANTGESHISPTSAAQEPSAVSNADGMRVLLPTQPLRSPECWCECCDTVANSGFRSRMSICPGCGDKRCPRAYHHNSDCSAP